MHSALRVLLCALQVAGAVLDEMLQTVLKKVNDAGQQLTCAPRPKLA